MEIDVPNHDNQRSVTSTTKEDGTPLKHRNRLDAWLRRLSYFAQIGLLVLAIIGYFYTVRPIYQKAVLEEEISRKTIQVHKLEGEIEKKEDIVSTLKEQQNTLSNENSALNNRVNDVKRSYNSARKELQIQTMEIFVKRVLSDYMSAFTISGVLFQSSATAWSLSLPEPIDLEKGIKDYNDRIGQKLFKTPYEFIRSSITGFDELKRLDVDEQKKFKSHIYKYIEAHREKLDRTMEKVRLEDLRHGRGLDFNGSWGLIDKETEPSLFNLYYYDSRQRSKLQRILSDALDEIRSSYVGIL